jgi:hypothetical protein
MRLRERSGFLTGICLMLILCPISRAETLDEELEQVGRLRALKDTPFDEVDRRCDDLLTRYISPEEQGKIYFERVQVEGQSFFQRPEKILEFISKALACPQEPLKKARLYIYWGDAIQVASRGVHDQELMVARRKAAMPYLEGLKESLQYDLPEAIPDMPMGSFLTYDGPTDTPQYRELMQRQQARADAQKRVRSQRDMIQHQGIMISQIAGMYSRFPRASNEIRQLATEVLNNKQMVDRLMAKVDEAVQKRMKELGWQSPLLDVPLPGDERVPDPERVAAETANGNQPRETNPSSTNAAADAAGGLQASAEPARASGRLWLSILGVGVVGIVCVYFAVKWVRAGKRST